MDHKARNKKTASVKETQWEEGKGRRRYECDQNVSCVRQPKNKERFKEASLREAWRWKTSAGYQA